MKIANVATYPARNGKRHASIMSIAKQVDVVNIALNDYSRVPRDLRKVSNANFLMPETDLKDVGKFAFDVAPEDDVFLCDDDIIYPSDYVSWMKDELQRTGTDQLVLGVHGVTYSDYYDGRIGSGRLVHKFDEALQTGTTVNQLGTGTVHLKGALLPDIEDMTGSSGYVDVRFARILFERGIPLYCVSRGDAWLREVANDESLYASVTSRLPMDALREVQVFGGLSKLMTNKPSNFES